MDAGWIAVAIFLAVLAVVVFAVARGMWRIWRGEPAVYGSRGIRFPYGAPF